MRSSLFLTVFFLCASCYYAVRLYKTKDIPFLDDAVEGFTEVIGFKPEIVKARIEKKEEKIKQEEKIERLTALSGNEGLRVVEEKKDIFAAIVTDDKKDALALMVTDSEKQKENDVFDNIASVDDGASRKDISVLSEVLEVSVFKTQEIANDGKVLLRLKEPFIANGKAYPKGFVFEATTALHEGELLIHAVSLGVSAYNSQEKAGGQIILARQKNKGHVVLTEGETINLYY